MLRSLSLIKSACRTAKLFKSVNSNLLHTRPSHAVLSIPAKCFHIQSSTKQGRPDLQSIDRSLIRLDSEIRKTGRISRREIEEILVDIRQMKTATSTQSLMIIRCCGELVPGETPENRTKLVEEVWKTLESLNVPVDISHYNALLRVYLENEHKFDPTNFLQELSNKGIEPNRVTYQRLVARYCQDGNIDGASTILQHMKEKQLPINEHVFNALVLGHAESNDMESAEGMLGVMRQAGLEPNDDTYTTLMSGYAKKGDISNVNRIVKECESKEIFLVDRDFLSVIYTLAASGHENLIDEVIPYLKKHTGFNQEVTNVILRLVNIGKNDTAFKLLQLMPRPMRMEELAPSGGFFIRQMVLSNTPTEVIISYCKKMEEIDLNKFALVKACEVSLQNRVFDKAFDLLEALKESGFPIRQHYFWPFFAGSPTEKEVYDGLKCMMFLEVPVNTETLREYVVPALLNATFKKVPFELALENLSGYTRIPITVIAPCALQHLLSINDIENAAKFALRYKVRLSNISLRRALIDTYYRTRDAKSVGRIVGSTGNSDEEAREAAGAVLLELLESSRRDNLKLLPSLLAEFEANGIGLSNSTAELIQSHLGDKMTSEITNSILKLTSGNLVRKVENFGDVRRREKLDSKTAEELEKLHELSKAAGKTNPKLQKTLLLHYCKDGNLEMAEKLREEMHSQGFVFTPQLQVALLDLYCERDQLDKAREVYGNLKSSQLDFVMDDLKILKYAHLLSSHGRHEELMDLITNQKRNEARKPQGSSQNAFVWKILNAYAEAGKVNELKEVFNTLVQRDLTIVNNVILGPLVKVHLVKDDLEGAMAEYERCVKEYRASPWKQELFVRFIKAEDADNLQKVLDLATSLHGEVNCLYDLVFAFLDCGKIRQAKKILDTPGLRARNEKLEVVCQRYLDADRVEDLEKLIAVTKDVFDVDRNSLYFYLLKAYCKTNDPAKALSVWTSLQEENLHPSPELLSYLADFLRKNNQEVPFVIPQENEEQGGTNTADDKFKQLVNKFRTSLRTDNLDQAARLKEQINAMEGVRLTIDDESRLIEKLIRAERLNQAVRITEELASLGNHPYMGVLKNLLRKLSSAADTDSLFRLQSQLPEAVLERSGAIGLIGNAMVDSGKGLEFFATLKKRINDSRSESATAASSAQYVIRSDVALVNVLKAHPELIEEVQKLASQASGNVGITLQNAIWSQNLIARNYEVARNIMKSHLQNTPRVIFTTVLEEMRKNSDVELGKELWSEIRDSQLSVRAKGKALGCLLDVQGEIGDLTAALSTLADGLKTVELVDIMPSSLIKLKSSLEKNGQKFPYNIPEREPRTRRPARKNAEDSSSSDSDSD